MWRNNSVNTSLAHAVGNRGVVRSGNDPNINTQIFASDTSILKISQSILFQYEADVIAAVSANVGLSDIPGFINFRYDGTEFDIHTFADFYIAQINMTALFQIPFGSC